MTDNAPGHAARDLSDAMMWGLPLERIAAALAAADGKDLASGKVFSPQSSSALAINAFGPFLERPALLPPLPGTEDLGWPAVSVRLEARLPFPWTGGRKPNLDVLIETSSGLIGVESKRFEPFDTHGAPDWSDAYWRPVWGDAMGRYTALRDHSRAGDIVFRHVEEAQLIKHALGLLTATSEGQFAAGKVPVLLHLRAEPRADRRGGALDQASHARVAAEVADFASRVEGDRVRFRGGTYRDLLQGWGQAGTAPLRAHAAALRAFFDDDI